MPRPPVLLLLSTSRQALPPLPYPFRCERLVLRPEREALEETLRTVLAKQRYDLIVSSGFAAAADGRLETGDILQVTRAFHGADLFLDLEDYQAPGAIRGSACTIEPGRADLDQPARSRYPAVYAFDDHAFWLARALAAEAIPTIILRATLLLPQQERQPHPLLLAAGRMAPLALGKAVLRQPAWWQEGAAMLVALMRCRAQLATTLTSLLVLHSQGSRAS